MTPTDKFVEAMQVFAGINKHSGECLFLHDENGCASVTWARQAIEAFADVLFDSSSHSTLTASEVLEALKIQRDELLKRVMK